MKINPTRLRNAIEKSVRDVLANPMPRGASCSTKGGRASAKDLIELARLKGVGIGRKKSGVYYATKGNREHEFRGSYNEFVRFIQNL